MYSPLRKAKKMSLTTLLVFSSTLIIFSASKEPKLNRERVGFPRNWQEDSFIDACSTSCTPLFRKLLQNRDKSAFVRTCPWPPSWPFSGTLIIVSAFRNPKLNSQSLRFPRNQREHSFIYACSTSCTPLFEKALTKYAQNCLRADLSLTAFNVIFRHFNHIFRLPDSLS